MQEITFNNRIYTEKDISNMRVWLSLYVAFAAWPTEHIDKLTQLGVLKAVQSYYHGGVIGFNNDHYKMYRPPFMQYRYNICGHKNNYGAFIYFLTLGKSKSVNLETVEIFKEMLRRQGVNFHGI